jgi:2-polyprenyl-6-methoxyphenol hydroxylase-like FAD-dependent oxidoreductase
MASERVALIGDASFVVRPHTGMGIAKAAGDVMSLREKLFSMPLSEALAAYQMERAPIGAAIAANGRKLGESLSQT